MIEVWKPINNYEGIYEVSNLGNIRSLDRWIDNNGYPQFKAGQIIKPGKTKKGYLKVNLNKNGECHTVMIHRLVGNAFLENPDNKATINHIDHNKENNKLSNLEWMTYSENNYDM